LKKFRIAVAMSLMLMLAACGSANGKSTGGPSAQASQSAGGQESAANAKVTITKEEYTKVKNGMSYKEVAEIVGGEGELISETGVEGDEMYAIAVMYEGEGSIGANANFIFLNDKLQTKAQFGLE